MPVKVFTYTQCRTKEGGPVCNTDYCPILQAKEIAEMPGAESVHGVLEEVASIPGASLMKGNSEGMAGVGCALYSFMLDGNPAEEILDRGGIIIYNAKNS